MNRRKFLCGGIAMLGVGAAGRAAADAMARHPLAGKSLPKWEKGHFRISMIYTGASESSFLVFPDGTSMLIDCGDCGYAKPGDAKAARLRLPPLPDASRRAGEWTARYVLRENPFGRKVDYFMLSHYHYDHSGCVRFSAGRSANGKYTLSGIGQALDFLDFGTIIDRAWPDMDDPVPRPDAFMSGTGAVKLIKEAYAEAERRGTKIEKFRLEKGGRQISLRHGGCEGFSARPLCSCGRILRRDGSILDLATLGKRNTVGNENTLSVGLVLSVGDFRYYTAGDFWGHAIGAGRKKIDFEDILAAECPQVDVAKANHHAHSTMPPALVKALRARVVLGSVWHVRQSMRSTMRSLHTADWPYLYVPGHFPRARREEDASEAWLGRVAPEAFVGAHSVIDVAPGGRTYRLMLVDARDERGTVLGAYDFTTAKKESLWDGPRRVSSGVGRA